MEAFKFATGRNVQLPQIIVIFFSSLAMISHGLAFSWTSPAIPELIAANSTEISLDEASYFTVISPFAMAISAPFFSTFIDVHGRKKGLLLLTVPQFLTWVLTALAPNIWVFYLARFTAGIGDAAVFATVPIYVCEVVQPKVRGTWGNAVSTSTYVGIFLINIIGAYCNVRKSAFICGCFPIAQFVVFLIMPESPYYLLMKGKDDEAKSTLRLLRWRTDVDKELISLKNDIKRQISETGTMAELFTVSSNRKALAMSMVLRIGQQFSGLPAFEMYTQYMFEQAGGNLSNKVSSIILSGMMMLCVSITSCVVEKFGRKPLTIFSCFGCAITLAIETAYFCVIQFINVDTSRFGWIPLVGMIAYVVVCSVGLGLLPTIIVGEVFSASIKGKATGVMNVVMASCLLVIPKLFQSLIYNFGLACPFALFSVCCFITGLFACFYMIETKGKSLEEIQQELKGNIKKLNFNPS